MRVAVGGGRASMHLCTMRRRRTRMRCATAVGLPRQGGQERFEHRWGVLTRWRCRGIGTGWTQVANLGNAFAHRVPRSHPVVGLESAPPLPARASLPREGRSPCAHRVHGIPLGGFPFPQGLRLAVSIGSSGGGSGGAGSIKTHAAPSRKEAESCRAWWVVSKPP